MIRAILRQMVSARQPTALFADIKGSMALMALRQLRAGGWCERIERATAHHAARYRLVRHAKVTADNDFVKYNAADSTEVFRRGRGLGLSAGRVYSGVVERGPVKTGQLITLLQMSRSAVERQLRKLYTHGLIINADNQWCIGSKPLAQLESELGLTGETMRQHERHAEQREQWRMRNMRRHERATIVADGSVVDTETGEVLMNGFLC